MRYVAHDAALAKVDADGGAYRAQLEASARRGNAAAIERLKVPEYPESLAYLLEWAHELVGRSGVGMDGYAPLSHREIRAWAANTGRHPTPDEVGGLVLLDNALRHPDDVLKSFDVEEDATKPDERPQTPAWPT